MVGGDTSFNERERHPAAASTLRKSALLSDAALQVNVNKEMAIPDIFFHRYQFRREGSVSPRR